MGQQTHTILLVEDEYADLMTTCRALRRGGLDHFLLQVVGDGDAAVGYLRGSDGYADRTRYPLPDLVLLDLGLPRRSGLEVLEWLLANPEAARPPVVVLTSSNSEADVRRACELGASGYLVKPVGVDAMADLARRVNLAWLVQGE